MHISKRGSEHALAYEDVALAVQCSRLAGRGRHVDTHHLGSAMTTNIHNKALQVDYWIDRMAAIGEEITEVDVRAYIERRWPDLSAEIKALIVRDVLGPADSD